MPSKKKKYNARFPAGRIKKIMQTDEEVGKVAQAVPVIISRALELFVESLLTKALNVTLAKNAKTLSPSHLKQCILAESKFDFLKDLVKNVPDASQSDERDALPVRSAESSPGAFRPAEVTDAGPAVPDPTVLQRAKRPSSEAEEVRSSDSGSDCEPLAKRSRDVFYGNGGTRTATLGGPSVRPGVGGCPPVRIGSFPVSDLPTDASDTRLPNFYTETLREQDEEDSNRSGRGATGVQSSVIKANPEYVPSSSRSDCPSVVDPTDTIQRRRPPRIVTGMRVDLPNDRRRTSSSVPDAVVPMIKIDLSNIPLNPEIATLNALPFVPMSAPPDLRHYGASGREPQSSFAFAPKSTSLDGEPSPSLVRFQFPQNSEGPTAKRPCPNEPPPLLPISPVVKASAASIAPRGGSMQLDEDYDT